MDLLKSKQLKEQRAKLIADARALLKDNMTAEDRTKYDAMDADIENLTKDIERVERQEAREREIFTATTAPVAGNDADKEARAKAEIEQRGKQYAEVFDKYARHGEGELTPEERKILKQGYVANPEGRAQSLTTTAGGYTVPQSFMAELERAQKYFGAVRGLARVITTSGGNALPWPTVDDTSNSGEDKSENTAASGQDVTFGQVTLNAYKMDTGLIQVSTELLEDTGINLEAELGSIMGERIARRQNNKFTVGTGSSTWQGVVIGASLGGTFAGTAAITADELFDVQHSVDVAYRNNPKCAWMFNDAVFKAIRKLKDGQNRYLFEPAITAGAPDTLLGKPFSINNDMATLATGNKTVVFGDFSKFIIRDVRGLVIRRLNERYAEADQVAFVGFYRGDSKVVSASSTALVYWKQA